MIKYLSTILLFLISLTVFGQFTKVDIGENSEIKAIQFIDNSLGFLVGSNGLLMKTTDQGDTWHKQPFQDSLKIQDLTMSSDKILYAACDRWIFESKDSGTTWQNITKYFYDTFYKVKVFDRNIVYSIHTGTPTLNPLYYIGISSDSGKTWSPPKVSILGVPIHQYIDWDFKNSDTSFITSSVSGLKRCYGDLIKSSEKTIYKGNDLKKLDLKAGSYLFALNDSNKLFKFSNIYAIYIDEIKLKIMLINSSVSMNNLYFIDQNTGLVYGDSGTIYKTFDGGLTWNTFITNTKEKLTQHYLLNDSIIFIFGENGTLLKSTNLGGSGISSLKKTENLRDIVVYPNPAKTYIEFKLPLNCKFQLYIYNINGKQILEQNFEGNYIKLNLTEFSSGVFLYVIQTPYEVFTGKLIIQN